MKVRNLLSRFIVASTAMTVNDDANKNANHKNDCDINDGTIKRN